MPKKQLKKLSKKPTGSSILDIPMDWRTIFDLANVIMVFIDDKQKVAMINNKGREILGYKDKKIIGKNWFNNFVPKEEKRQVKRVFDGMMSGEMKPYGYYENHVLDKKGKKRLISWHNTFLKDPKGRIKFTLSSGVDITGKRHMSCCKQILEMEKEIKKLKKSFNEKKRQLEKIEKLSSVK